MDVLLIVFLTLLNGAFAMSEMAIAASRRTRLLSLAQSGDKGAAKALELMDQPTQFLSTVQVGITSIGMLNGILGAAAFSGPVAAFFMAIGGTWGLTQPIAEGLATAVVIATITYISIVFGELVPKRIGQLFPEAVARWIARPMAILAKLAKPFVRLLSISTQAVLHLLRIDTNAARTVTEEEISASIEEAVDAGLFEAQEHQMVRNVFDLDDRPLTSIMLPRADIAWLDANDTVTQALQIISQTAQGQQAQPTALGEAGVQVGAASHSWYPVCRGSLEDVVGIVSVARLLALQNAHAQDEVGQHVQPATFVPETLTGLELLSQFRVKSVRMAFVVDEYGEVQGLLTPLDLLEAITGELQPRSQETAWATQRQDGSWLIDGAMPIEEFKNRLDLPDLPGEETGRFNTVAGFLMAYTGRLLQEGDIATVAHWRFEVVDMDGRRIDKIIATAVLLSDAPVKPSATTAL